jgi:hypothetical protein
MLNAEERRKKIREFVEMHEGISPEQCFKALEREMARSTFFGHLSELKSDGIITVQYANKRDKKLFLNKSNILVSSQKKLDEFDKAFSPLLKDTKKKILGSDIARDFSRLPDSRIDPSQVHSPEQINQLSHARLAIFFRMIDSILLQSLIVWPKKIEDKDTLKKLYVSVFLKISDMVSNYSESYDLLEIAQRLETFRRLHGALTLLQFQAIYENVGMKQKIDAVIDSLWDIDKEIIPLAYKEKEYWSLDWKESDGWRKLLALVKDKVESTAD